MALFAGTTLTRIENRSGMTAVVLDLEHPEANRGHRLPVVPGGSLTLDMPVPWCADGSGFAARHLDVRLGSATSKFDPVSKRWVQ